MTLFHGSRSARVPFLRPAGDPELLALPSRAPPGLCPASSLASEHALGNPGYHGLRKTFPGVGGSGEATMN